MKKITIEPESQEEYDIFVNSNNLYNVIKDFGEYLRKKTKYENLTDTESEIYNKIKDKFWEIVNDEVVGDLF
jgi:hypothetical protein